MDIVKKTMGDNRRVVIENSSMLSGWIESQRRNPLDIAPLNWCMGVFLRSGWMVSNLVVEAINIGYKLLTLLNVKCFIILSRIPWGDIIVLRKVCRDLGHIVLLVF
jgi:hypothetical protein